MQQRRSCGARLFVQALVVVPMLLAHAPAATADDQVDCRNAPTASRVAACTRLIEKPPRRAKAVAAAHLNRRSAYRNRADNARAIADYTRAMQLDPTLASQALGLILIAKGEHDLAIAALNDAIRPFSTFG